MKNRMGLVVLVLMCVVLGIGLIWTQTQHSEERRVTGDKISALSNKWVRTEADLEELRQVNVLLTNDLGFRAAELLSLSNQLKELSTELEQREETLKAAQQEIARRDAKISQLESQNEALDQQAMDLSTAITNLTTQIAETQQRLAASEGDRAFLEQELQRLMAEKAELERQFNDLAILRTQVAKLKEELNIARRLEWIRKGLFASTEQKGAEQLMQKSAPQGRPAPQPSYDLNVEVGADGTVRVIPPMTNAAAASPPVQ